LSYFTFNNIIKACSLHLRILHELRHGIKTVTDT